MAGELRVIYQGPGTPYCYLRRHSDGVGWIVSTGAFSSSWNNAHLGFYKITLTDSGGGLWMADFPVAVPIGTRVTIIYALQIGDDPDISDLVLRSEYDRLWTGLSLTTGEYDGNYPVTLAEVKRNSSIDSSEQDAMLSGLIAAATEFAENATGRKFLTSALTHYRQSWPTGEILALPKPPLQSVESVHYKTLDGDEETLDEALYTVDTRGLFGAIVLNSGQQWPTEPLYMRHPIRIEYTAGYGDTGESVPVGIRNRILAHVDDLYQHRGDIITGTLVTRLNEIRRWYQMYRVWVPT